MTRLVVTPGQLDLTTVGRRDYWVALEHDSIWGDWLFPLTVWVGPEARPGEGMVAFGSTHGNEYEGPIVLKHLLTEISLDAVKGRIIVVPVLNAVAFEAGARESVIADGVNLNRAFVAGAGREPALGGITHRLARFVRDHIWEHVDVSLDIHSGGNVARYAPLASFHRVADPDLAEATLEMARWFGVPFLLSHQDRTPGLLKTDSERLGIISVGGEFGWGAAVQAAGVEYVRHGVMAAAIHHGQLAGTIEPIGHHAAGTQQLVETVDRACFVPAPWPGHYEPLVECGVAVEAGQTVGLLHDFHRIDERPWAVKAQVDGFLIAQAWLARVQQGQHIAVVGREIEPAEYQEPRLR